MRRIRLILSLRTFVATGIVFGVIFVQTAARGGDLNPPDGPGDAGSQMYPLEALYNRLDTGAAGSEQGAFTEPAAGPADGQGKSINDIMDIAPALNETTGARPEDVRAGKTFWSLRSDGWGPSTGTHTGTVCRAKVTPTVWKIFDCYNLAAIGKTTRDDPFTPSWRLIGGYWQWGRKGPDPSLWHTTNTSNFAHGPTGPGAGEANDSAISGWDTTDAPDGSWSDASKTTNDPCPAGYRVPTITQWDGVRNNNTQSTVGSWTNSATNYSSARFFGNDLMLPAAGNRDYFDSGALYDRGNYGLYWSSSEYSSAIAWNLSFISGNAYADYYIRHNGSSVRCIAE